MSFHEVNYNIVNIATNGYNFVGSDSVRIDAHFQVSSVQQEGVYSQYDGCMLFNFGHVASTDSGFSAVDFRGNNCVIANEVGGTMLIPLTQVPLDVVSEAERA